MSHQKRSMFHNSLVAAASLALVAGSFCTPARAQDASMSADDKKAVADHMEKVKQMIADPAQADAITTGMARMMVMDKIAKMMAEDPQFQHMAMQLMSDPAMKKLHDDAKAMADDPDQMAKIKSDIMADPKAMGIVDHEAMKMTMMHGKMGDMGAKMMDKMGGGMK